jgi:opacity protein-like surface antigen
MIKKIFFSGSLIAALFTSISDINAQDKEGPAEVYASGDHMFGITYNMSIPDGKFRDFIEKTSFRGFSLDYESFIMDNLSLGLNAGYAVYDEVKDKQTVDVNLSSTAGATIHAKVWKYTHVVPIELKSRYYYSPDPNSWVHLFGGVGVGTSYVNQELWVGLQEIKQDYWRFSVSPEAGFDISTNGLYNIQISTMYQYILNGQNSDEDFGAYTIRIGFRKWIN